MKDDIRSQNLNYREKTALLENNAFIDTTIKDADFENLASKFGASFNDFDTNRLKQNYYKDNEMIRASGEQTYQPTALAAVVLGLFASI